MRNAAWAMIALFSVTSLAGTTGPDSFVFSRISNYGGVVHLPNAAEPPRQEARVVFDTITDSKPGELNRGLESAARYLNLHAAAGHAPEHVRLAVVLHGAATKVALRDESYSRRTGNAANPNLPLIRELKRCGVELFVCGQSLARNQMEAGEVSEDFSVAVSAMTVSVNKQRDGYAYISVP